jgi:hypothetical protein
MTRRSFRFFLSVFVFAGLFAVSAFAQKITGDIVGTVDDPTGAVVAGATIKAENPLTGFSVSATTNESGSYRIVGLAPGTYKVSATASGFKTVQRDVTVAISTVTASNFQMVVGAEGESITVEASIPLVETIENRLATSFEGRRVEDLPISGRDFNSLLQVTPGVSRSPGGGFQSLNINGQRATAANFAIDGIPNNDRYYGESSLNQAAIAGTAATLVSLESISEFTVQGNPSAEYGVRGGPVVNVGLKSGTNEVHGQVFWIRHTDFADARNFFAEEVTPFRLNQFGAAGGFPLKKDKSFVFASYQGFRLKSVFPAEIEVPTPNEIFDATQCVITGVNPNTAGTGVPCLNSFPATPGPDPGPGSDQIFGTADDGTVSTIGSNLLSFIPTDPSGQLFVTARNSLNVENFHVKFDHLFSDSHRLSAKYIYGDSFGNQPALPGVPEAVGPLATSPDMWNSVAPSRAQQAGINYTWTISSNKILESRLGYQRFSQRIGVNNDIRPSDLGINTGPGIDDNPDDPENLGVPTVYYLGYFGGNGYATIGGIQGYPIVTQPNASYDWQEHFTWVKGNHTLKIGGQYQNAYTKSRRDRARTGLGFYYYGFYYCASYALCDPSIGSASQSDHVLALNTLLLGMADGASRSFGETTRRIYQHSVGLYVQDSWKVKPNFTLEIGLRWDLAGALGEEENRGSNFLPGDPLADADGFVALSALPLYEMDKNNFGPRIGFAWDMFKNGKTVLRGGYGLNYDLPNFATIHAPQTFFNMFSGARSGSFTQVPQGVFAVGVFNVTPASNLDDSLGGANPLGFDNPLCQVYVCMAPGVNIYGQTLPSTFNIVQVVRNFRTPMLHAANLTLEREIAKNLAFSVGYAGTFGRQLPNWRNLNACPVNLVGCDDADRPFAATFPQYRHITQLNNDSYSNYNSLQTALKFRGFHGLTGQVNFTWSKVLDTGSSNRGFDFLTHAQNPYDVDYNYGVAEFDQTLNFNFSFVYDVPKLGSLPKWLGEGWQINTLFQAFDGRPFTPFFGFSDPSNQGLRTTRAGYDGSPIVYNERDPDGYVQETYGPVDPCGRGDPLETDPANFLPVSPFFRPCDGTLGTAGRGMLRQPGIAQLDTGIFKNTKISERVTVQFRWEVFNVLNRGHFAMAGDDINSADPTTGAFGTFFATPDVGLGFNPVLGTGAQRNMQFGIKVIF